MTKKLIAVFGAANLFVGIICILIGFTGLLTPLIPSFNEGSLLAMLIGIVMTFVAALSIIRKGSENIKQKVLNQTAAIAVIVFILGVICIALVLVYSIIPQWPAFIDKF
ncbi:MAG: hypothetical protein LBM65_02145 [Oscillospiraceae bacterium]|nr:hypothetical protein [Oscillospiraceae bacterium]